MADEKPECFVICPIGTEGSDVRRRSDVVLEYVIRPAVEDCGYEAIRADKISEPGSITNQVISHVLEAPMLVADLTGHNANVFYELAIRHAARKPYVQLIQKGEKIPFDVAGIRTIELDHTDLKSVDDAKRGIREHMKFSSDSGEIANPISTAIDFKKLISSDDPTKRQLSELMTGVADLRNLIESKLPNLATPEAALDNAIKSMVISQLLKSRAFHDAVNIGLAKAFEKAEVAVEAHIESTAQ